MYAPEKYSFMLLLNFFGRGVYNKMWISCLHRSIRKFRTFGMVKMWAGPFLRVAVQLRADIRLDYFGHGLGVRMEVVNGRRRPYLAARNPDTLHDAAETCGVPL